MSIAFLFPGQGAQHIGMGRTLVEKYPAARELFDRADSQLGFNLSALCFEGPQEELDKTSISQPALFVSSLAALEMQRAEQADVISQCEMAAGLSLGEYTALTFAGAMSFEDGLRVVQKRGEAMQAAAEATASGMISALLLQEDAVNEVVDRAREAGRLWIANYLCPMNTVLSGETAACDRAETLIEEAGGKPVRLAVAGAFHTEIMQPAVQELADVLASVELKTPSVPVISNVDAQAHSDPDELRSLLVRQVENPVLWEKSVRKMLDTGVDHFYEIGPGKVLKGLLKRIARKVPCETVNDSV